MTPKTGTLTKIYMADTPTPTEDELTLIMYTEEIPAVEEAAEAISYQTTDMDGEEQSKGSKVASTPAIPVLYQATQHQALKEVADSNATKYFFIRYPEATAPEGQKPLVKSFSAQMDLTGDTITSGDIIKDTLTLYRNSSVTETFGLPTASDTE